MNQHKSIFEAQLAVMAVVPYLQKTEGKGLGYSYVSEAELIHAVRAAMIENGITVCPVLVEALPFGAVTFRSGTKAEIVRFTLTYRFTHSPSGTGIDVQTIGEAADTSDKASSKAQTQGLKYALRQFLLIETGNDPDIVAINRDEPNAMFFKRANELIEKSKTEAELDAHLEKFRGQGEDGQDHFTPDKLGEVVAYAGAAPEGTEKAMSGMIVPEPATVPVTAIVKLKHGILHELAKRLGGQSAAARELGVAPSEYGEWINFKKRPPRMKPGRAAEFAAKILELTGHTVDEIWPQWLDKCFGMATVAEETREFTGEDMRHLVHYDAPIEGSLADNQVDALNQAMRALTFREREIIKLRYGIGEETAYTLSEVGRIFKVTQERIRTIESKAIAKLRYHVEHDIPQEV